MIEDSMLPFLPQTPVMMLVSSNEVMLKVGYKIATSESYFPPHTSDLVFRVICWLCSSIDVWAKLI